MKMLRIAWKIVSRVVLASLVLLYVVVALLNYSVVQSMVGSVASDYFSREWGGRVRITSIGCNPMNHLVLRGVDLVAPGDDTVCVAGKMALRFDRFPYDSHGLTFSKMYLKDVIYHLNIDTNGINLKFIMSYYAQRAKHDKEKDPTKGPVEFKVLVDDLILDNVCYRQDLKDRRTPEERLSVVGVDVKHMEYRNINAHFRNVRVDLDRVTCRIDQFSTNERSGLEVRELRGNVYATRSGIGVSNLFLETADSRLSGDVLLDYCRWKSMGRFLDSVFFTVHFDEGSYGGMQDAAYWAHTLWGMDERIAIQGDFSGPISDFRADNVRLAFGNESTVDLDAYICGLPHIDSTVIGAEIHHLHTTYDDLNAVRHPWGITMKAKNIVKSLKNIDMEATFAGKISNFYTTFSLATDQGDVDGDLFLAMNPKKRDYRYAGHVSSDGFGVGRVFPNEWLSRGAFDFNIAGTGFDPETMNASADGQLHHLVVKGQRLIGEVAVDADATGGLITVDASLDDELVSLNLHGEGDWRGDYPVYRANVDAQHLDLKRFGLWDNEADSVARISFVATAHHSESDDANSYSRLALSDVQLLSSTRNVRLKNASLSSRKQNHWMNTTFRSDLVDANLRGYYEYSTLPVVLRHIVDDYLPQCLLETNSGDGKTAVAGKKTLPQDAIYLADTRFEFNMEWKDSAAIIRSFLPKLGIAPGSTIQANYNYADGFKPILRSDSLRWGNFCFYDVGVNAEAIADHYSLQMKSDRLMLGQLQFMDYGTVRVESSRNGIFCRLLWQNSSQTVGGGDVALRLVADSNVLRLASEPSHLAIGGRDWHLVVGGDNFVAPGRVHVDRIGLTSEEQRLLLAAYNDGEYDSLMVNLSSLGLDILNPFFASSGIIFGGKADGSLVHTGVMTGEMFVEGLLFNGEELGDIVVHSKLDDSLQRINITIRSDDIGIGDTSFNLFLDGYGLLANDKPELFFDAAVNNLDLKVVEPFVNSFSSRVVGTLSADLSLRGTLSSPLVSGSVALRDGSMNIDFLNVAYSLSDTITLEGGAIRLDSLTIFDPDGGSAIVDGIIEHHNFSDFNLNLSVNSGKLLCMNTTQKENSDFYGRIVASATGWVRGLSDNLNIQLDARTLQGTSFTVPINDKRQMEQADYIHFVTEDYYRWDDDSQTLDRSDISDELPSGFKYGANDSPKSSYHLTINIEATPDMQYHMPMEFSSVAVDVTARGRGDLQMTLGTGQGFALAGDYEISSGTLLLDLLGTVSKEFAIDDGSSITLPGNLQGTMFDIRAVLSQRVNLSTLTGTLASTDSQKPVQVENVIALSGTLTSPNIGFDIRLPNADQSVQEEVFSYIDRNSERDMLNQTISLLLTKRFYNASVGTSESTANATGTQAYGFVLGTLGSFVSDMVQVVDVNFDYQSGNGLTTDQYAVDISREWNKFYFESSFGFGGESLEMSTSGQGTNNMTGDMLVGYKINPRLHLFVFNRSNTNDYTRSDLPYKQGIGLKYTRDFDRLVDYFRRKKKQ